MKKRLLTTFAATLSLFMSQCSELPTQKETADGSKSIKIEIKTAPGFDTIAANAYVQISADDMKSTITQKLTISNDWISGVVRNIPVGYSRHFEVFVQGFDSTLLYYGDTTASIYSGKETYVTIILRKPGGTAIINGYIEEYEPPQDSIPAPDKPYIYSYDISPTKPPRISQLTLVTNGSKYPDSLFYVWNIFYIAGVDSFSDKHTTGQVYSLTYPKDGFYQISVRAMSMYDSSLMSSWSYSLLFTIKNGLLTDTITMDTLSPVIYLNGPDSVFLKLNSSYVEQGAKAYDNVDGDLTSLIKISGKVDSSKAGIYLINYYVIDKAGNVATKTRMVIVSSSPMYDTIAPVLTLIGPTVIQIAPEDTFLDPGCTAWDDVDGDITSLVKSWAITDSSNVNRTTITYNVCDKASNCSQITRLVVKEAKVLPTPSMPTITSSKFNGKTMSISFETSVIKPISSGTVYYDWTIITPDTTQNNVTVTTTKNSLNYNFDNNRYFSIMVMARCLGELSYMSHVLQFSILNGKVVYPEIMKPL